MNGLSTREAAERLSKHGPNELPEPAPEALWRRFLRQFASPLVYLLLFALAFDVSRWLAQGARSLPIEAVAIAGILTLFLVGLTYGVLRKRFMVAWDTGAIAVVYAVAIRFLFVFGR
jgi:magnesium-transporting ATPase (P-type)